jgi:hypothetical protein
MSKKLFPFTVIDYITLIAFTCQSTFFLFWSLSLTLMNESKKLSWSESSSNQLILVEVVLSFYLSIFLLCLSHSFTFFICLLIQTATLLTATLTHTNLFFSLSLHNSLHQPSSKRHLHLSFWAKNSHYLYLQVFPIIPFSNFEFIQPI